IVSEVEYVPDAVAPDEAFRNRVNDLQNRPLTSVAIVDLLVATAAGIPKGATGIKLEADRDADNGGVRVHVSSTNQRISTVGTQKGWENAMRVHRGRGSLYDSAGFFSYEHARDAAAYDELARAIEKAVASKADVPFKISVSLIQSK